MFQILDITCSDPNLEAILDIVNSVINLIKIIVPIALILMGSIDLAKAVFAGKDDDIKKATGTLFKRFIAGLIVFLMGYLVNIIVGLVYTGPICQ